MTLTAQFYYAPEQVTEGSSIDTIIRVSARCIIQYLDRAAVSLTRPCNVHRVTMLISASGKAAEEFCYGNAASEFKNVSPDVSLDRCGPHREL
ncbi:hypothetical protein V1506DRAFT_539340 [Lipomyces tetrasporus]